MYLNHLAMQKFLENSEFINYLDYLQYFNKPEYIKFLRLDVRSHRLMIFNLILISYPGPTLKALELLQQEGFRKDILMPETVQRMIQASLNARLERQG